MLNHPDLRIDPETTVFVTAECVACGKDFLRDSDFPEENDDCCSVACVERASVDILEYIRTHPGCHRIDIAGGLELDCDHVHDVVAQLSVRGLAYQNQETREHYSIVDGWAR